MNDDSRSALTPVVPTPGPGPAVATQARLEYLFRVSLREGQIHPLLHLVRQYREKKKP